MHNFNHGWSSPQNVVYFGNFHKNWPKYTNTRGAKICPIWDRCYDFLNIFAKTFGKKSAFFTQNKAKLCKHWIITLVFKKNAIFFAENWRKSRKIVIITSTPGHPVWQCGRIVANRLSATVFFHPLEMKTFPNYFTKKITLQKSTRYLKNENPLSFFSNLFRIYVTQIFYVIS
jgi:hypothetical protein